MDRLTKEQRHKNMKNIKSKDTGIEVTLRKALWKKGYRYRKNDKKLPGKPDIVLPKYQIAIFCDSEFFHGKDWKVLKPRLEQGKNADYWVKKIQRNMDRDSEKDKELLFQGWTVIHFWGKDIIKNTETLLLFKHNYSDREYIKKVTKLSDSQIDTILNLGGNQQSEKKRPGELAIIEVPTKRCVFLLADYLKETESEIAETDAEVIASRYRKQNM